MTEDQVYQLLAVLGVRYPAMPLTDRDQQRWVNALARSDHDAVTAAAKAWMERRAEWPTVAELRGTLHLHTAGLSAARQALRAGYESEVLKQGRTPSLFRDPDEAPSPEPGSLGSDSG